MMLRVFWVLFSATFMVDAPAIAQSSFENPEDLKLLQDEELRAAFADKTHYGTYKQFREETGTSQYTEHTKGDGSTLYTEGEMKLKGQWRSSGDRICYRYDEEIAGVHCFVIFELGTCLYGYSPNNVTPAGPIDPNYWNAKSIRKGDVSTCDDLLG